MVKKLIGTRPVIIDVIVTKSFNMWFQKISIPTPRKVIGNSEREGGVSKDKFFKGKYEAKQEIPGGRGVQNKIPSVGEVQYGYVLEPHIVSPFSQNRYSPLL